MTNNIDIVYDDYNTIVYKDEKFWLEDSNLDGETIYRILSALGHNVHFHNFLDLPELPAGFYAMSLDEFLESIGQ